jgi:hypothetical protein
MLSRHFVTLSVLSVTINESKKLSDEDIYSHLRQTVVLL